MSKKENIPNTSKILFQVEDFDNKNFKTGKPFY